jgi:hypothetical protein
MAPGPQARESDCVRPQRLAEISPYDDQCLETRDGGPLCGGRSPRRARIPTGSVVRRRCWADPIHTAVTRRQREVMLSERTNGGAAHDLLVAAEAVEHTDHGGDPAALPRELEALGDALHAAGRVCEQSAFRIVPGGQPLDRGICSRYQRAAASWPTSQSPSYERFAAALASLHGAAEAARQAARRCDRAREAVDGLLRTSTRA